MFPGEVFGKKMSKYCGVFNEVWMTIEYLKCKADLNFEVDFGANGAIGTIMTNLVGSSFIRITDRFHP